MTNLRLTKQLAELAEPVDAAAEPIQEAIQAVPKPVRDVLDGVWLGNPLHPALTDIPLGAWTAALALDLAGSEAADNALAVGILGAVPTALTGLNDWSHLKDDARRIGTVHALVNSMALALNVASFVARRDGHRGLGRVLSGVAYAGAAFSAHLGGPLDEGKRDGDIVTCPWHGSRFDLCTGEVRGGPAVYPQPRYETRVRAGKVEIRVAKDE